MSDAGWALTAHQRKQGKPIIDAEALDDERPSVEASDRGDCPDSESAGHRGDDIGDPRLIVVRGRDRRVAHAVQLIQDQTTE